MQMGTSQKAAAIYSRARKILKDASEFIASPDF
jgi:U3 small nucleolar RNA-associated protein 6